MIVTLGLSATICWNFAKKIRGVCRSCIQCVDRNILTKTFYLWKRFIFLAFLHTFVQCFTAGLSKWPPTCPEEQSGEFFWIYFGYMLGLRAKNYRTLEYKALPLSSKQHPIYWKDHIWEILFLNFLRFQKFLPTVGEIFVDFRQIFSDRVFKTVLHASRVTFWGTLVFLRKNYFLIQLFSPELQQRFSETHRKSSGFSAKKNRVVKTVFHLSDGGFVGKQLSSKA